MASLTAYQYLITEANSTINQIAAAQQSAANLTLVSRSIERTILNGILSEIRALCVAEPSLEHFYLSLADAPVLQLLDTRGQETARISLPSLGQVRDSFYSYLTGSGYTPASTAEANAYYQEVNERLAERSWNESAEFSVIEAFAQAAEKEVSPLLDHLRILAPPLREWFHQLAWEAGDGDDRARELLGYSLSSVLMSQEIDDYSFFGQELTTDRITLRLAIPEPDRVDQAKCLLDERNGNLDTTNLSPQCFTPFGPEQLLANEAALDSYLRFIPALHSSGGIATALAKVQTDVPDPDLLAEASAELINKGTTNDPVLLAIQKAAQQTSERYGLADLTQELLELEARAHDWLALSEDRFGPKSSAYFRIMSALGPDPRLSGYRRREGLMALRDMLLPQWLSEEAASVPSFLWMLAERRISANPYTRDLWQSYLEGMPDDYWALEAYVEHSFISPEIVVQAQERALEEIRQDLAEAGTGLLPQDPDTFKDALLKLATVAVTPEDRRVQRERLRDIGQRMSILADTLLYRRTLEVATGGGYLAPEEHADLYQTLFLSALRAFPEKDPERLQAELGAFGQLSFSDLLASDLFEAMQQASDEFFSQEEFTQLLGEFGLSAGALAFDRYWTSRAGPDAKLILDTAILLSRTLHTATDPSEQEQVAEAARSALGRLSAQLAQPQDTLQLLEALMAKRKTPQAKEDELKFLSFICRSNQQVEHAYQVLTEAVDQLFQAIAAGLPPVSMEEYYGATALAYYPLRLFAQNNEYAAGITIVALNHAIQGGRVLSNFGSSATLWQAAHSYGTDYFSQGFNDVVSQVPFSSELLSFGGGNPLSSFDTGILSGGIGGVINSFVPDMRGGGGISGMVSSLTSSLGGGMSGGGQNVCCQCDALNGLIKQLNGVQGKAGAGGGLGNIGGAISGGINNALKSVNDTLYGMTNQLNGLIKGIGSMGALNNQINCKCAQCDLTADLRKMLNPISSWLTNFPKGFKMPNIFDKQKNPFKLGPNDGCSKDFLGNLGSGVKFPP